MNKSIMLQCGKPLTVNIPSGFTKCSIETLPKEDCCCLCSVYWEQNRYLSESGEMIDHKKGVGEYLLWFDDGFFDLPDRVSYGDIDPAFRGRCVDYGSLDGDPEKKMSRISPYAWEYRWMPETYYKKDKGKYIDDVYVEIIAYHEMPVGEVSIVF